MILSPALTRQNQYQIRAKRARIAGRLLIPVVFLLTSAALHGEAPYRQVLTHGFVVDADGKKMSKSVGNIINPYDVFDTVGADALRWYFLARLAPAAVKILI